MKYLLEFAADGDSLCRVLNPPPNQWLLLCDQQETNRYSLSASLAPHRLHRSRAQKRQPSLGIRSWFLCCLARLLKIKLACPLTATV